MYIYLAAEDRALKDTLGNSPSSSSARRASEKLYLEHCLENAIECCGYIHIHIYIYTIIYVSEVYWIRIGFSLRPRPHMDTVSTSRLQHYLPHLKIYYLCYISHHIYIYIYLYMRNFCLYASSFPRNAFIIHANFFINWQSCHSAAAPTHDRKMFAPCQCCLALPQPHFSTIS